MFIFKDTISELDFLKLFFITLVFWPPKQFALITTYFMRAALILPSFQKYVLQ